MWQQCAVLGGGVIFFGLKYLFLISTCGGNATPMRAKLRPRLIAPYCGVARGGRGGNQYLLSSRQPGQFIPENKTYFTISPKTPSRNN